MAEDNLENQNSAAGESLSRKSIKALPKRVKSDKTTQDRTKRGHGRKFVLESRSFLSGLWKISLFRIVAVIFCVLLLTAVYMMIVERNTGMYNPDIDTNILRRFVSGIYFGLVTLSTSGYGDYTPRSVPGRLFTIFFLVFTIVATAVLSATITSIFVERRLKEGWGMGTMSDMKNHFIICGWKKNMPHIISTMINNSKAFKSEDVVLIANIIPGMFEDMITQMPLLQGIRFIKGDYYNEVMLKRANIAMARQIFILADESDEKSSASEIDSKTVMAAMTINALSPEIRVCAELLDMKFEKYLVSAHVDEIVYSNEYSRLILGISSDSAGISRVLNDILDMNTEARIITCPFPDDYIGKTYYELRVYFNEQRSANLIGLVENVGSLRKHKRAALREAQKTADISKLIGNLKKAKAIISNNPNIHPDDDYIVPKNSLAIIIERVPITKTMISEGQ